MDATHFEDFTVGDEATLGRYEVTADEIVDFARQYDPQPFHVDPEAARDSPFGGLVASGWHTAAMTMRVLVEEHFSTAASHGALGVEELEWREPVRPGDVLEVSVRVEDTEAWDDDRGVVVSRVRTARHRDDATLLTMRPRVLYERRDG